MSQSEGDRFVKSFDLFPAVGSAPVVKQADADSFQAKSLAKVYKGAKPGEVVVDNGVVQFTAGLNPLAAAKEFKVKATGKTITDLPMPTLVLNGEKFVLGSAENKLNPANAQGTLFAKPFDVRNVIGAPFSWPPRGMGLKFTWNHSRFPDLFIELRYQMIDREPVLNQSITIRNGTTFPVGITSLSQGDGLWPLSPFAGENINLILRPGRVLELPEAWFSIDSQGKWVSSTRQKTVAEISPWTKVRAKTLKSWPPVEAEIKAAAKEGFAAVLMPKDVEIAWSAPTQADFDAVGAFMELAKKSKVAAGAEVDLADIPSNPEDLTGGAGSPVCWHSFSGNHWRQNAILTWKRMGLQYVQLTGALPTTCDKTGHGEHQTEEQGAIENYLSTVNLMRNGLSLGIIIRHVDAEAFGPEIVY